MLRRPEVSVPRNGLMQDVPLPDTLRDRGSYELRRYEQLPFQPTLPTGQPHRNAAKGNEALRASDVISRNAVDEAFRMLAEVSGGISMLGVIHAVTAEWAAHFTGTLSVGSFSFSFKATPIPASLEARLAAETLPC